MKEASGRDERQSAEDTLRSDGTREVEGAQRKRGPARHFAGYPR